MKGYHHARLEVGALDFILEEETGTKVREISQVIQLIAGEAKIEIPAV